MWALSSLVCSRQAKCGKLATWSTSAFAGMLWRASNSDRVSNQHNKRVCVMPSKSLSIYYCTCSGQCHALLLASELTSVRQALKGSEWNAWKTLSRGQMWSCFCSKSEGMHDIVYCKCFPYTWAFIYAPWKIFILNEKVTEW